MRALSAMRRDNDGVLALTDGASTPASFRRAEAAPPR
jgi:hypothetical protein